MNKNLQTLITYQAWRTGDDHAMPDPADISQALNWAIGELTYRTTTDNTEVILRLERDIDKLVVKNDKANQKNRALMAEYQKLRDLYRTEQSLHAATERHNATLSAENAELVRLHGEAVREREEAVRRAEQYRKCAIESQDWDWLTAKEENEELGNEQFQVPDMQDLYLMANNKEPNQ